MVVVVVAQRNQGKKVLWIISSLLIEKWLFKIETILKLLSTMPTRKRPRKELIYYFVDDIDDDFLDLDLDADT